jgi:hypothetical protein
MDRPYYDDPETDANIALILAMKASLPTLLDDLAAAQGEVERLREALQIMVDEEVDYMTRNNLGDPEKQHTIRVARSALTLKSEKAPSSLKGSDVGEVGE